MQNPSIEILPTVKMSQKFDACFRVFLDEKSNGMLDADELLLSGITIRSDERFCTTDEDGVCFLYLPEGINSVLIDASDSTFSDLGFVTFQNEVLPIAQAFEVTLFTEESFDFGLSR